MFENLERKIPSSMSTFTGRPNLIIYCAPKDEKSDKKLIDVQFLIEKASDILLNGSECPLFASNSLGKLTLGLQNLRKKPDLSKTRYITKVGQEETFQLYQYDVMKVAKWLTYFDEFQKLRHSLKVRFCSSFILLLTVLQMDMLKGFWIIWSRLEKLATVAAARREGICKENQVMLEIEDDQIMVDTNKLEIDLSWCSRYTFEQLKFFGEPEPNRINYMAATMAHLKPTDVELTFMLCQLCLHHVGKRYQGEILEVSERLQESLSNDLHDYYANQMNMRKYSDRLASMMKVNNLVQQGILQRRAKVEFMKIFDVFYVEYSDPEMFVDY
ncbi:hypothetical protein CRE_09228 [Caenorhabditis remanei]|uniref:NR LBD domain-containing protein n=1 Tax=Caenorhabditis remanei TaxID=31234 RepID=E3LHL7_CAERE|nr:hypothetical protein CRE_09228 [Caenorhabditis remanei]